MIRRKQLGSLRRRATLPALIIAAIGLSGCTDWAGYDLDYALGQVPFIGTMRRTVAFDSHTLPRLPAEGTVPVISPMGEVMAPFTQVQIDSVAPTLSNPLPASQDVLARGAVVFANQCFACHGAQGEGNGPVVGNGRFPAVPSLKSAGTLARSDGYLYAIIRVGRGSMPPYGAKITHDDRWAVVHYVRQLQQQGGPAQPAAAVAAPPVGVQPATPPGP